MAKLLDFSVEMMYIIKVLNGGGVDGGMGSLSVSLPNMEGSQMQTQTVLLVLSLLTLCLLAGLSATQFYLWRVLFGRLDHIIEGKRLSAILRLEPASPKIDPSRFAPKKEKILPLLLGALDKQWNRRVDNFTKASDILTEGGIIVFVHAGSQSWSGLRDALIRLIVNDDKDGAQALLEELVDKL